MITEYDELIRKTQSVCPECLKEVPARIVSYNDRVYLIKECLQHGKFSLLISKNQEFYKKLNRLYFSLFPKPLLQKDYIVHITNRCNLSCPICLANSNSEGNKGEYSVGKLKDFLKNKKNFKIDLMGAEPTIREDLSEIIKAVKRSGNIPSLHTNGLKLTDYNYLRSLKEAGLEEVHFQFDGFKDSAYRKIRGRELLNEKLEALGNLEKLSIPTDLKVTVLRGINDDEFDDILRFGVEKDFVKEIFFLGCRFLGRAKYEVMENCMMPDELVDMFIKQNKSKIDYEDFLKFHNFYYRILRMFSIRKCFYNRHLLLIKNKNSSGYIPVTQLFSLKSYFSKQCLELLNINLNIIGNFAKNFVGNTSNFFKNFKLSNLPEPFLLLGFISACDSYSYDSQIAMNCGKGAISSYRGVEPCGALDNINRDYNFSL